MLPAKPWRFSAPGSCTCTSNEAAACGLGKYTQASTATPLRVCTLAWFRGRSKVRLYSRSGLTKVAYCPECAWSRVSELPSTPQPRRASKSFTVT